MLSEYVYDRSVSFLTSDRNITFTLAIHFIPSRLVYRSRSRIVFGRCFISNIGSKAGYFYRFSM